MRTASAKFTWLVLVALASGLSLLTISRDTAGSASASAAADIDDFDKIAVPFLTKHCFHCHGPDKKPKGNIAFHKYKDEKSVLKDRQKWIEVLNMVRSGEMPPKERPRPEVKEADAFVAVIEDIFLRADKTAKRDPGRVTMRRLNRVEYKNTVRDLLGIDFDVSELPQDDVGYGFDNIGDVLTLSPLLMERYLLAAESIVLRAFPTEFPGPVFRKKFASELEPVLKKGAKLDVRPLTSKDEKLSAKFVLSADGNYKLRIRCGAKQLGSESVRANLEMNGKTIETFTVKPAEGKMEFIEAKIHLKMGDHRAAVSLANEFEEKDKKRTLLVETLELIGPMEPLIPETRIKLLAGTSPSGDKKANTATILKRFVTRAYRRPATEDEIDRLCKFVEKGEKQAGKWDAGLQLAFKAVLCSPKFLFRVELDQTPDSAEPHPIDDYQLASRLSYFLWNTMPDDELFALAEKKQLHQEAANQVKRMLKDPRADTLVENFGMQWLQLRTLKNFTPDAKLFPDWNDSLRQSMLTETELFLKAIVHEDRSILDIVDSDFTFMNERLAKHYGLKDVTVKGSEFQRVSLKGSDRGGILTQASVLAVNSNPTRTSPVKRGRWVLEQILGTPPPPPPPDVPELDGNKNALKGTLRQRMEQHRANPSCAFCHARMDPIGFGFENFDAVGKFRMKDGDFPIDPSGTLPSGQVFNGPGELRAILMNKKDLFTRNLTEKMLTYGLGRGLEYYDRGAVDTIMKSMAQNDYRFSVLVTEVVKSDPFRLRRGKDQQ